MSPQGSIPRWLNRNEDSKIELVVPGDYPGKSPKESLISVEATAHLHLLENGPPGSSDEPPRLLLGIKSIDTMTNIEPPKQLRLLHVPNNDQGVEFNAFLRRALEAYGLTDPQTRNTIFKFFDRFLALSEQSAFRGGRFSPVSASTKVRLPGRNGSKEEEFQVNFIAIPYFLLRDAGRPPQRTTGSRTKVHWVQPLVQSGYHLDSSMTRENQQAIRRLYSHIKQVIHVPQLWVLSIGHRFVATCSPTPLFDGQRSSSSPCITLRTIGGQTAFPPTVRVTTPWGFVFCLERGKCGVWFEFLYRVQVVLSSVVPKRTPIDTRNWIYILEVDGSTIDARRWRSLWEAHGDDNSLLAIIASPPPDPIPPRKELTEPTTSPNSSSTQTPELCYPSSVSGILEKIDKQVREHRERRSREIARMQSKRRINHPYQYVDPYYSPPRFVLDAVGKQSKRVNEDGDGHGLAQGASGVAGASRIDSPGAGAGSATQRDRKRGQGRPLPIFKWPIGKKPSEEASSDSDEATSTRRMKSLLAYIHRHMLFHTGNAEDFSYFPLTTAASTAMLLNRTYNALPLKTRSSVDSQLLHLRDTHHVDNYILDLLRTFVRGISDLLDEFIAHDYECIVKGKVWAAVLAVLETFRFSCRTIQINILEEYYVNILAIPLDLALRHVRSIREGLAGVKSRAIPWSMVDAFVQIVVLLVEAASEGERIVAGIERIVEWLEGAGGVEHGEDSGERAVDSGSLDVNDLKTLNEGPGGRNGDPDSIEEDSGSSDAKNANSLEKSARDLEKSLHGSKWKPDSLEQSAGDLKSSLDHMEEDSESMGENLDSPEKDIESPDAKNPDPLEKCPNSLEETLRGLEKNPDTLEETSGSPETNPENLKDSSSAASSLGPNMRSSPTDRPTGWVLEWLADRSRNSLLDNPDDNPDVNPDNNPDDNPMDRSKGSPQDGSGDSSKYTEYTNSLLEFVRVELKYRAKYRAKYRLRYSSEDLSWSPTYSSRDRSSSGFRNFRRRTRRRRVRNVGLLGPPSDHYSFSESETEAHESTPPPIPYNPSPGIDSLFAHLDHARDECCAMFRSEENQASSAAVSGLGLIVARILESVLKGHSTCKEMPDLDIGEVYATYTTALQLEARNRPSKNLLLDINLLREELETILANINEQLKLIFNLRTYSSGQTPEDLAVVETENINFERLFTPSPSSTLSDTASDYEDIVPTDLSSRAILQAIHADLQEQEEVFTELIKRANILERQIVQRVDIIQEDHGKAILVFTIVSVIFLPLSFVSSYLGMNTADIRDMELNQALFWQVALPVTVVVVALVLVGAYNASKILGWVSKGAL
ncbi:hypothetical protein BDV11DRAFT_175422 [Aspergillus similis]